LFWFERRSKTFAVFLPDNFYLVGSKGGIGGHQGHVFARCLGNKQPVERITMVEGQGGNEGAVGKLNGQPADAVQLKLLADFPGPVGGVER
jgi:hypothetical protein